MWKNLYIATFGDYDHWYVTSVRDLQGRFQTALGTLVQEKGWKYTLNVYFQPFSWTTVPSPVHIFSHLQLHTLRFDPLQLYSSSIRLLSDLKKSSFIKIYIWISWKLVLLIMLNNIYLFRDNAMIKCVTQGKLMGIGGWCAILRGFNDWRHYNFDVKLLKLFTYGLHQGAYTTSFEEQMFLRVIRNLLSLSDLNSIIQ